MSEVGFPRAQRRKRRAAVGGPRVGVFNPCLLLVLKQTSSALSIFCAAAVSKWLSRAQLATWLILTSCICIVSDHLVFAPRSWVAMRSAVRSRHLPGNSVPSMAKPPLGSRQLMHLTRPFLIGESANLLIITSFCTESNVLRNSIATALFLPDFLSQRKAGLPDVNFSSKNTHVDWHYVICPLHVSSDPLPRYCAQYRCQMS